MENEKIKKILEQNISDFFKKAGFNNFSLEIVIPLNDNKKDLSEPIKEEDQILVNVNFPEKESFANYLIGKKGTVLAACQHLIRVIIKKKIKEKLSFNLDINQYRKKQKRNLIRLAESLAQKVLSEKKATVLDPMNPYERRIIHSTISNIEGLKTESVGREGERKIIIKPVSLKEELFSES